MIRRLHLLAFLALGFINITIAQVPTINLGRALPFALFAQGGFIESNSFSPIVGNVGVWNGARIQFNDGLINGAQELNSPAALGVFGDVVDAFTDGYGRAGGTTLDGDLGEKTFAPGVYNRVGNIDITTQRVLTLDANNNPNGVFIFQISGDFTIQPKAQIRLTNGASACNVFFIVQGTLFINSKSIVAGNFLVAKGINTQNDASLEGGLYVTGGDIRLDNTHVNRSGCPPPIQITVTTMVAVQTGPTTTVTDTVTVTKRKPCRPTKPIDKWYEPWGDANGHGEDYDPDWNPNGGPN